jgi:hypothetical protein
MATEDTQALLDRYFQLMGRGDDFTDCCTTSVTWTTFDDGTQVQGREPVRNLIEALHDKMRDAQTRKLVCSDDGAYLEGDCADVSGRSQDRLAYCVAYDVADGKITAMRCYGAVGR